MKALLVILLLVGLAKSFPTANNLLVVYAENFPVDDDQNGVQDSKQIAQYYASTHNIPSSYMLGITINTSSTTNFEQFGNFADFYNMLDAPLNAKLAALGTQKVECILLVYGLPYVMPVEIPSNYNGYTLPYNMQFRTVDSRLFHPGLWNSLLNFIFFTHTKIGTVDMLWAGPTVFVAELTPGTFDDLGRFYATEDFAFVGLAADLYLVSRLDGPGKVWGIINQIDRALYANKHTTYNSGTLYVDTEVPTKI